MKNIIVSLLCTVQLAHATAPHVLQRMCGATRQHFRTQSASPDAKKRFIVQGLFGGFAWWGASKQEEKTGQNELSPEVEKNILEVIRLAESSDIDNLHVYVASCRSHDAIRNALFQKALSSDKITMPEQRQLIHALLAHIDLSCNVPGIVTWIKEVEKLVALEKDPGIAGFFRTRSIMHNAVQVIKTLTYQGADIAWSSYDNLCTHEEIATLVLEKLGKSDPANYVETALKVADQCSELMRSNMRVRNYVTDILISRKAEIEALGAQQYARIFSTLTGHYVFDRMIATDDVASLKWFAERYPTILDIVEKSSMPQIGTFFEKHNQLLVRDCALFRKKMFCNKIVLEHGIKRLLEGNRTFTLHFDLSSEVRKEVYNNLFRINDGIRDSFVGWLVKTQRVVKEAYVDLNAFCEKIQPIMFVKHVLPIVAQMLSFSHDGACSHTQEKSCVVCESRLQEWQHNAFLLLVKISDEHQNCGPYVKKYAKDLSDFYIKHLAQLKDIHPAGVFMYFARHMDRQQRKAFVDEVYKYLDEHPDGTPGALQFNNADSLYLDRLLLDL